MYAVARSPFRSRRTLLVVGLVFTATSLSARTFQGAQPPTECAKEIAVDAGVARLEVGAADSLWAPKASRRTWVFADYGPQGAIRVHSTLQRLAPEFVTTLSRSLAGHFAQEVRVPRGHEAEAGYLVWARDYSPIFIEDAGAWRAVIPLSVHDVRRRQNPPSTRRLRVPLPGSKRRVSVPAEVLPIVHENGNLVSTGEFVLTTDQLLVDNQQEGDEGLAALGYRPRSSAEVLALFRGALGLDPDQLIVLPRLPSEATGHIDNFVLALGPREVMVPQITPEQIGDDDIHQMLVDDARRFLETASDTLRGHGLVVHRLPMLAPRWVDALEQPEVEDLGDSVDDDSVPTRELETLYLSPANSVLFDGGDRRIAFLPAFHRADVVPAHLADTEQAYEAQWTAFFAARGYVAVPVEASELARHLGLLRCVTSTSPTLPREVTKAARARRSPIQPRVAPKAHKGSRRAGARAG